MSNSEPISEENIPSSDCQASHDRPSYSPVGSGTAAVAAIDSGAWVVVGDTADTDAESYPPFVAAGRPAGHHRSRMTDCQDWLTELTHAADRILKEDLAALQRMSELARLDRYESITRDEEALRWEFTKECNGFLTSSEEDRLRGELRLARLLLAASFYADGDVPESIADDFIEPELQAVVDFDRFKRFDTLDESQLEARIQRLDGEVTELLETYADSTVANIDALLENPDVQQDVIDRLLDRYEERRERVRQAIFLYAETHGLETLGGDLAVDDLEQPTGVDGDHPTGVAGGTGSAALAADTSDRSFDSTVRAPDDNPPAAATAESDTVAAATARLFELDYLGRFETSIHEADTIHLPEGSFSVPENYWEGRCSRRNERDRMADLLETNGGDVAAHPVNPTARYAVTDSKYFGLTSETRMVVEATVYSHLGQHAREGVDATPAGVDDLVAIVGEAVDEAADRSAPYLLGIASPTGWTDRVVGHVQDDELSRTHYGPHVSVCLIDLQRGELIYDTTDSVVAENAELFERAVQADAVADCVDTLRSQYLEGLGRETLLLTAATEETGYDRHVVRQAFSRLEADDEGEVFSMDEEGVAFEFR